MTIKKKIFVFILLFLFLWGFIQVSADEMPNEEIKPIAVSLIIDSSGSMKTTDPNKLRETAANMFIDLLGSDDSISIISFDNEARELVPMTRIDNASNKALIKGKVEGQLEGKGDTDYVKAFDAAKTEFDGLAGSNVRKVIIFLTDGNPDPDPSRSSDPSFMVAYLEELNKVLGELRVLEIPVYSFGFGTIDTTILNRISLETKGSSKVLTTPDELALEFFNILSSLKMRNNFISSTYNLQGNETLGFTIEGYVKLTSLVVTNDNNEINIELIPPAGVSAIEGVVVNKTTKYTSIMITQNNLELSGDWKIKIIGNGAAKVFGDKDLAVKLWIKEPINGALHTLKEPLEIVAELTGSNKDNLSLEAIVSLNGIPFLTPIYLNKENGVYKGTLLDTKEPGTYEIVIRATEQGKVVANASEKVFIKLVPKITTDYIPALEGYLSGSEISVSASLRLLLSNMVPSEDMILEYINLDFKYDDGTVLEFPLTDNGVLESGDLWKGDGIYSFKTKADKLGKVKLVLSARGSYKGELYILEKVIDDTIIYGQGSLNVYFDHAVLKGMKGSTIVIPFSVENNSEYSETLKVDIPINIGVINNYLFKLKPGEKKQIEVAAKLNQNINGNIEIPVSFTAKNDYTEMKKSSISIPFELTSNKELALAFLINHKNIILVGVYIIVIAMAIFYGFGKFLYFHKVISSAYTTGTLYYMKKNRKSSTEPNEDSINLAKLKKPMITISMDSSGTDGDYQINNSYSKYRLIIEARPKSDKASFIEGWRAVFRKPLYDQSLVTTDSGVILIDDNIQQRINLNHDINFESGGFLFRYQADANHTDIEKGSNILEGRF